MHVEFNWLMVFRMVERLIDVMIGGGCVYLGYRLFVAMPEKSDSEGKIVLPGGVSIWLSRVGPGIFFALFGVVLVGMSFQNAVETTSESLVPSTSSATTQATLVKHQARAMGGSSNEDVLMAQQRLIEARKYLTALNSKWPRALRRDLPQDQMDNLILARDFAKRQILHAVWSPSWGNFEAFEQWLREGAVMPPPSDLKEAAELYRAGMEGPS